MRPAALKIQVSPTFCPFATLKKAPNIGVSMTKYAYDASYMSSLCFYSHKCKEKKSLCQK